MYGGSFTGDSEEGETVLSGDLVYWGHREIHKKGSGNGHLSP